MEVNGVTYPNHHRSYDADGLVHEYWVDENFEYHHTTDAARKWYRNGHMWKEKWYKHGQEHRSHGPACTLFHHAGVDTEFYYKNGLLHCEYGPALIRYNSDGSLFNDEWYMDGEKFCIFEFAAFIDLPQEDQVALKLIG